MKYLNVLTVFLVCVANAYGGGFGRALSNGGNAVREGENYMEQKEQREYLQKQRELFIKQVELADKCAAACGSDINCQRQCYQAVPQQQPSKSTRTTPPTGDFGTYESLRRYRPPTNIRCQNLGDAVYCSEY